MLAAHSLLYTAGHGISCLSTIEALTDAFLIALTASSPREQVTFSGTSTAPEIFPLLHLCTPLSEDWLCLVCLAERLQDGGGCHCHVSQGMVTGLVDGGAFQGRSMGGECSAAQASSWRVLNPWKSPAGSNKHKQPKKPELTKPFLHHCLGKSHSCHSTSFSTLSCWREVVWGAPKAGGLFPSVLRAGSGGSLPI